MVINIETHSSNCYDEICAEYGEVLEQFGLMKKDEKARIVIYELQDVFNLHREITNFCDENDKDSPYFGLMIKTYEDGTPYIEIADNFS